MRRAARWERSNLAACAHAFALIGLALLPGCEEEAPARSQLLVFVDTDLPASAQVIERPELSGAAVVDTIRVDVLPAVGSAAWGTRTFLAPDARDWPLSFGVVLDGQPRVRLRIRAFRGALASSGKGVGEATVDPWPEVTVDRLVDLDAPSDGVRAVRVVMRGDCMGVLPSFSGGTTCIDGTRPAAPPGEGVDEIEGDAPPTVVGSWAGAMEIPCRGMAPEGSVCVPGGFTMLGHAAFRGVDEPLVQADSFPLRPVRVSPFFMDRTEVTVGRLRALVAEGRYAGAAPAARDAPNIEFSAYCSWLGDDDAANDALPVNCVSVEISDAICVAAGGTLPSEAQWEHAARGRGFGLLFPWGEATPTCCITSASREAEGFPFATCPGEGVEAVGSHPPTCPGEVGDVSRDGVLDLAGSVSEATLDTFQRFDDACWAVQGVPLDPVCRQGVNANRSGRGSSWSAGLAAGAAPYRRSFASYRVTAGLRCVYPLEAE